MAEEKHRCGVVAIVGRPNVGKSTLLNRLLGTKIAIVTPKPQTTRDRILGILTIEGAQILFQDTPGIHETTGKFNKALNRKMMAEVDGALRDCDAILVLVEAPQVEEGAKPEDVRLSDEDMAVIERVRRAKRPGVLAINKIDLVEKKWLLPLIDSCKEMVGEGEGALFRAIVPLSALEGDGIDRLLKEVVALLPEGPPLYPADQLTDRPIRFLVAEIIREKIILFTRQEVPYSTAVRVEEYHDPEEEGLGESKSKKKPVVHIAATIVVEKPSQKKIVIGEGGAMIRKIGTAAREEIEHWLGKKVYLELHVKVAEDWTRTLRGF